MDNIFQIWAAASPPGYRACYFLYYKIYYGKENFYGIVRRLFAQNCNKLKEQIKNSKNTSGFTAT